MVMIRSNYCLVKCTHRENIIHRHTGQFKVNSHHLGPRGPGAPATTPHVPLCLFLPHLLLTFIEENTILTHGSALLFSEMRFEGFFFFLLFLLNEGNLVVFA